MTLKRGAYILAVELLLLAKHNASTMSAKLVYHFGKQTSLNWKSQHDGKNQINFPLSKELRDGSKACISRFK